MKRFSQLGLIALTLAASDVDLRAQIVAFPIGGHEVAIHGFFSQGYMKSDGNNFITAQTGDGTFAITDGALNIATNVTDKFHVGAQVYGRNIGRLGKGQVQLDWAYGDYRLKDWLGFRAGKVKTPLGLYNDTQDMDFLHPWALLPQANYPTDLRAITIAHTGGDIYGQISLSKAGSASYQAYGGAMTKDMRSGYIYGLADSGFKNGTYSGVNAGFDAQWHTPLKGLRLGSSYLHTNIRLEAAYKIVVPASSDSVFKTWVGYAEYRRKGLTLASEYRHEGRVSPIVLGGQRVPSNDSDLGSFFASAAYRFTRWFQLGTYNSRFSFQCKGVPGLIPQATAYIHDQSVTGRFDIHRNWTVKVEQHFMDGVGSPLGAHSFYTSDNPQGLQPKTKLFVVRFGFNI